MAQIKVSELSELTTTPLGDSSLYIVEGGVSKRISVDTLNRASSNFPCDGRLTLTSGDPTPTGDETGTTVYFTPFKGDAIATWNGTRWETVKLSEISISMSGLTPSRNYDIFISNFSGGLALTSVIWTNDNTRNVSLSYKDGILVYGPDNRYRYIGTVRLDESGNIVKKQSSGSGPINFFLWNYYNRVPISIQASYLGDTYTYTTSIYRKWANNDSTTINVVIGWPSDSIIDLHGNGNSWNNSAIIRVAAMGINGVATALSNLSNVGNTVTYGHFVGVRARPAMGLNSISLYQYSGVGGTSSWSGGVSQLSTYA